VKAALAAHGHISFERIGMRSFRSVALLAGVALVAVVAGASAATRSAVTPQPAGSYTIPVATASGGSVGPLVYPSIVNVRLLRAQAALDRATVLADQGQSASAAADLAAATANMTEAWTAAKYVIETAPPPVAGSGAYAHTSGAAPGGSAFASPEDTAFAVFNLHHTIVTTLAGLIGTVDTSVLRDLRVTVRAAMSARDDAVAYIHAIPVPPPAGKPSTPPKASKHAKTSGGAIASGWGTVMPNLVGLLEDEMQLFRGTNKTHPELPQGIRNSLKHWRLLDLDTRDTVNTYWPPVPAG
jgi:hypothetical protein